MQCNACANFVKNRNRELTLKKASYTRAYTTARSSSCFFFFCADGKYYYVGHGEYNVHFFESWPNKNLQKKNPYISIRFKKCFANNVMSKIFNFHSVYSSQHRF